MLVKRIKMQLAISRYLSITCLFTLRRRKNDGFVDTTLKEEKLFNFINKALKGDLLGDESSYGTMMNLEAKPRLMQEDQRTR